MRHPSVIRVLFILFFFSILSPLLAQQAQQQQAGQPPQLIMPKPRAVPHAAQRYEVDAKRTGTNMNSDDALPRSREFLRIDSTYYVGWMFEGAYKYNHAADYLGYKNAIAPLLHALHNIERDYRPELATRTHNILEFIGAYPKQLDYAIIVNYLNQCYLNTEDPEANYKLLRRYAKWNFQKEFFDEYNYLMWITHRNRFYTHDKYSFLKNSIADNERLANAYLDTSLRRLAINGRFNVGLFKPGTDANDYLGVYHYKSLLYAYALNIDSAQRYFDLLRSSPAFPHNNYATFRAICGDFRTAETEYKLASQQDPGDKRLQEWAYYSSIIDIYKGLPKNGELQMKDMIQANGSTPGFGWYNIALARCLYYDGQIAESERYANKAAEFKELHIGTTLGQSHYDFSIQLNKLMTKEAEWSQQRFEHSNWWYNPSVLWNMSRLMTERYLQEFLIINLFAQNPERDQVIYKLFSTESTVSWDEVWQVIHNFSTQFFLRRFEQQAATDSRKDIRKYFRLFTARLHIKEGDYKQAQVILNDIIHNPDIDNTYEKLFIARTYQALAECADGLDKPAERDDWLYKMYVTYPQLIPFSNLKMNMQLTVSGTPDDAFISRLKACNIHWSDGSKPAPRAILSFSRKGNIKLVSYAVIDAAGNYIVPQQLFSYSDAESGGTSLAYRLFGVGGKLPQGSRDDEN